MRESTLITGPHVVTRLHITSQRVGWDSVIGGLSWLGTICCLNLQLAEVVLLLGPLVVVPLGLQMLRPRQPDLPRLNAHWLIAAASFVASFGCESGTWAGLLATPWLLFTLHVATRAFVKCGEASIFIRAAMLLLPVGGVGAVLSRAGLAPFGFSDAIILMTGVHFHFAGFALPLLTDCAVRSNVAPVPKSIGLALIASIPLVGVGITFSPLVEVVAALVLAASCSFVAFNHIVSATRTQEPTQLTLLAVSGLSHLAAMSLAVVFAVSEYLEAAWIGISTMVQSHGVANAFGFVICGLLARLLEQNPRP